MTIEGKGNIKQWRRREGGGEREGKKEVKEGDMKREEKTCVREERCRKRERHREREGDGEGDR